MAYNLIIQMENTELRFQSKPLDNAIGLGARVLLKALSRIPIKILLIAVNLNKAAHILGSRLNF